MNSEELFNSREKAQEARKKGLFRIFFAKWLLAFGTTFILPMVLVASAGAHNPSGTDLDPRCVLVNRHCQGGGGQENDYLLGYGFAEW